jgi:hypothetical protein
MFDHFRPFFLMVFSVGASTCTSMTGALTFLCPSGPPSDLRGAHVHQVPVILTPRPTFAQH